MSKKYIQQKPRLRTRMWRWANTAFNKACTYYFRLSLLVTGFSLLLQTTPRLVSKTWDAHMAEQGYPENGDDKFFNAGKTYVYDRGNILVPFHMTGRNIVCHFQNAANPDKKLGKSSTIPVFSMLTQALSSPWTAYKFARLSLLSDNNIFNASALVADMTDVESRSIFIYPPEKKTARECFEHFANMDAEAYRFRSDTTKLADIFYKFVMYHERRHGDQAAGATIQKECDADLYAFDVLKKMDADKAAQEELHSYIIAARATRGLAGDSDHASGVALLDNEWSPDMHLRYGEAAKNLHEWVSASMAENEPFFDQNLLYFGSSRQRIYYLVSALLQTGTVNDPDVVNAAVIYTASCEYLSPQSETFRVHSAEYIMENGDIDMKELKVPCYPFKPAKAPSPAAP